MRRKVTVSAVFSVIAVLALIAGCGGGNELGRVGEEPITREEFLGVFNGLPAEEQVGVLEPGGRMNLMERIVRKKLLLLAWEEDVSVSREWEELYKVSFLADSMLYRMASGYDPQVYIDSLSSCGYSGFTIRTVLLDDSADAASLAEEWNSGDYTNALPSMPAPWSDRSGTSYRTMAGPVHRLTGNFTPLLSMEQGIAHVVPMYGEWCVCILELTPGQWTSDESAASVGMMNMISSTTGEVLLSRGIKSLAENCSLSGTVLVPSGAGDDTPVALLIGDTLSVSDLLGIMRISGPENFFGGVPEELSMFSPPEYTINSEITLWFYVKSVAQRYALSNLALQQGITLPEEALSYARAESVVRDRVLRSSIPDSAGVAAWFGENSTRFTLPERRSVLLGYTDSLSAAAISTPSSIEDIPGLQTVADTSGAMIPTPLQVQESFGDVMGPEVFRAEIGVVTGPVFLEGELAGWFEVVEIEPPGVADLEEIFPVAATAAAGELFQQGFEDLIAELRSSYPVEIDTSAVVEIDLWGSAL